MWSVRRYPPGVPGRGYRPRFIKNAHGLRKTSNPIKKWAEDSNRRLPKEGVQTARRPEEMLRITNRQRSANLDHSEPSPRTCPNGHRQQDRRRGGGASHRRRARRTARPLWQAARSRLRPVPHEGTQSASARRHVPPAVHRRVVRNSQDTGAACAFTGRRLDKVAVPARNGTALGHGEERNLNRLRQRGWTLRVSC